MDFRLEPKEIASKAVLCVNAWLLIFSILSPKIIEVVALLKPKAPCSINFTESGSTTLTNFSQDANDRIPIVSKESGNINFWIALLSKASFSSL